ncbi:hypothetical protein IKG31_00775 [Candidatus Saccharibacteria bacterium]|nr:hypothetical protein [Candidatus Saccharibacteria bacterium]
MDEAKIEQHLLDEIHVKSTVFAKLFSKVVKYEDIKNEFCKWLDSRSYDYDNQLAINGFSVKKIHEMAPFLEGIGVYDFLATLRDDPEEAENNNEGKVQTIIIFFARKFAKKLRICQTKDVLVFFTTIAKKCSKKK